MPARILIVEDNHLSKKIIMQQVELSFSDEIEIVSAETESEARRKLLEERAFHIVIMDKSLKEKSKQDIGGVRLICELRQMERSSVLTHPPAIIVTTSTDDDMPTLIEDHAPDYGLETDGLVEYYGSKSEIYVAVKRAKEMFAKRYPGQLLSSRSSPGVLRSELCKERLEEFTTPQSPII